jgi:hypothetical protein
VRDLLPHCRTIVDGDRAGFCKDNTGAVRAIVCNSVGLTMELERFVNQQNIERYRQLLDISTDEPQRWLIFKLMNAVVYPSYTECCWIELLFYPSRPPRWHFPYRLISTASTFRPQYNDVMG